MITSKVKLHNGNVFAVCPKHLEKYTRKALNAVKKYKNPQEKLLYDVVEKGNKISVGISEIKDNKENGFNTFFKALANIFKKRQEILPVTLSANKNDDLFAANFACAFLKQTNRFKLKKGIQELKNSGLA